MIVLDTNVASELIRPGREPRVGRWMGEQDPASRCITAITAAELGYGVSRLPAGQRREALAGRVDDLLAAFAEQVVDFGRAEAGAYGPIRVARQAAGRPISVLDAQIAAICRVHGAALATRNTRDFEGLGLELVNPWEA